MIWIIGGTKDSRIIAEKLFASGKKTLVSTATSYGKKLLEELKIEVLDRRMDHKEMKEMIKNRLVNLVIDASHPYADKVSQEAMFACKELNIHYIRYEREVLEYKGAVKFSNIEEIIRYLNLYSKDKNIMSTLGSKNLPDLLEIKGRKNIFIRILPTTASVKYAEELGYLPKNIIALQGPFSKEFNIALIKNYEIEYLITKESGTAGGELEKAEACMEEGVKILVLKRPEIHYPVVFNKIDELLKYVYIQK